MTGLVNRCVARPMARLVDYHRDRDGRIVVVCAVTIYTISVALAWNVWTIDLWPWLGVPPRSVHLL